MIDRFSHRGMICDSVIAAVLLIGSLAASAGILRAQTAFGSIVGTVTDASQAAIPAAAVTLRNTGTGERRTSLSDASGNYQFVNLVPGSYRLEVTSTGFKRYSREP